MNGTALQPSGFRRAGTVAVIALQVAVAVLAGVAVARFVFRERPPTRGTCAEAVERTKQLLPAPRGERSGENPAALILGRVFASRPELSAFASSNGGPDAAALLTWAGSVPDISSLNVAYCVPEATALASSSGIDLPDDGLPLLGSMLSWMESRTSKHAPFLAIDRNRNAIFTLHSLARRDFVPGWVASHGTTPTSDEVMTWAWHLDPSSPNFDEVWTQIAKLELR